MAVELGTAQHSLIEALRTGDLVELDQLLVGTPRLLREPTGTTGHGDLLAVAAGLGDLEAVRLVHERDDHPDIQRALAAACRTPVARYRPVIEYLLAHGANPNGVYDPLRGPVIFVPCESARPDVLRMLVDMGADPQVEFRSAGLPIRTPLDVLLSTEVRDPGRFHHCVDVLIQSGVPVVDSPWMAVCRGDEAALARHLDGDPALIHRRFNVANANTPMKGATLLHVAAEFCEIGAARLLLARGADLNARAALDERGFGGQSPIFHTVNSIWNRGFEVFKLLIEEGADVSLRASIHHASLGVEIRDVTPLEFALRVTRGGAPHPEVIDVLGLIADS